MLYCEPFWLSFSAGECLMWMILGFAALGLLIGNLIGMTSEGVIGELISLLFVFVGGSLMAFLHKLTPADRRLAGGALLLCLWPVLSVLRRHSGQPVSLFVTHRAAASQTTYLAHCGCEQGHIITIESQRLPIEDPISKCMIWHAVMRIRSRAISYDTLHTDNCALAFVFVECAC